MQLFDFTNKAITYQISRLISNEFFLLFFFLNKSKISRKFIYFEKDVIESNLIIKSIVLIKKIYACEIREQKEKNKTHPFAVKWRVWPSSDIEKSFSRSFQCLKRSSKHSSAILVVEDFENIKKYNKTNKPIAKIQILLGKKNCRIRLRDSNSSKWGHFTRRISANISWEIDIDHALNRDYYKYFYALKFSKFQNFRISIVFSPVF